MFSQEPRQIYQRNPLAEVICQLRFPEILSIGAHLPVDFQEAIRDEFPQYQSRLELPAPKINGTPQKPQPLTNYQFTSADGLWSINLTSRFISITCKKYLRWEIFAKKLDKPLAAFIKLYKPAYFERIGLRYLNFVSRKALELENIPFSQLFEPCWLGPLGQEDVHPGSVSRCGIDTELTLNQGCRVKIHAGPGMVKRGNLPDPEPKFIFDLDLYTIGKVSINHAAGTLESLHSHGYPIFRGAITDMLHDAMEPI